MWGTTVLSRELPEPEIRIFVLFYREKKKELEREELWKKLEELKLKKALEKQNSAYNMHSILSNTSAE